MPVTYIYTSFCKLFSLVHPSIPSVSKPSSPSSFMRSVEDIKLDIKEPQGHKDASSTDKPKRINYKWWLLVSLYTVCLLVSQSATILLGRFYYANGGQSKWLNTLVQTVGFPLAVPFLFVSSRSRSPSTSNPFDDNKADSALLYALLYIGIGILISVENWMYSYGLMYVPVSTYSLLCATQLAFNTISSYFLNSLKLSFCILNSVVLLTISTIILAVLQNDPGPNVSSTHHIIGFLITIGASALYSVGLSLVQLCFEKFLKEKTSVRAIMEMQIYPAMVASCIALGGLLVSKEWRNLTGEMLVFKTGKFSYVMTLVWSVILWEVFSVSCLALIYEVGSLFSNVIGTVGLPIIPVLALVFFKDKMEGMKIVALALAVWGFISYIYQNYLNDLKSKATTTTVTDANDAPA